MPMRPSAFFLALATTVSLSACSSPPQAADPPPVEEPPPAPVEEPPAEVAEPAPEPEPAKPTPKTSVRYPGRTVVATQVERSQIRCSGATEGATMQENRALCVQGLEAQVTEPDRLIVVIDETPAAGCPTCVTMLAEVSEVASDPPGRVLFAADAAGDIECSGGDSKLTLEDTRKQCYATLQKQGASLRAGVVLPLAIIEGDPCKSCISIVAAGYTATVLP